MTLVFEFIYFLILCYLVFYLPGKLIFHLIKVKFSYPANYFTAILTGLLIFTFINYAFAYLKAGFLLYIVLFAVFYKCYRLKIIFPPKISSSHRKVTIFLSILALIFSLQMTLNGNFGNRIYFFGDDIAHLAYIAELKNEFPPQHPGFSGIPLKGYHFFSDFLIASLSNFSGLNSFSLYFHFIPLLISFGWAFGAYSILYLWTKKFAAVLWGTFFVLFGSSFSFILLLLNHPNAVIHSNFGIDQPVTALLNQPYSLSVVILFQIVVLTKLYLDKKKFILLTMIGFFVGITSMFKIYAGMIAIAAFFVLFTSEIVRKNFKAILAGLISLFVFTVTFLPFAGKGAGLFYLPLWPIERIFRDIFPAYDYKEKIDTYTKYGVIRGLFITYFQGLFVFLVGNLGTRFVGILILAYVFVRKKRLPSLFSMILLSITLVSVTLPLFFAQTLSVFNMIQSTWYYPVFASFFAAAGLTHFFLLKISQNLKKAVAICIIIFTLPLSYDYLVNRVYGLLTVERHSIKNEFFQSMEYLRHNGKYSDTVLEVPLDESYVDSKELNKWFRTHSVQIPAFGNKRMYIGYQYIIFDNMPVDERLKLLAHINAMEFSKKNNPNEITALLKSIKEENIKYIYAKSSVKIFEDNKMLERVFRNNAAVIYKMN